MKFTVIKYKSSFCFFKYIEISFDECAYIGIDTVAANIKSDIFKKMILAYF